MSFETLRAGLLHPYQSHQLLAQLWTTLKPLLATGQRFHLEVRAEKRTDPQNRRLWAMLTDVADQVEWYGARLTPSDWKDVFTASLTQQRVVPALEAGKFVLLGQRTSRMSKGELSDLMTLIEAFGAERGVRFADDEVTA